MCPYATDIPFSVPQNRTGAASALLGKPVKQRLKHPSKINQRAGLPGTLPPAGSEREVSQGASASPASRLVLFLEVCFSFPDFHVTLLVMLFWDCSVVKLEAHSHSILLSLLTATLSVHLHPS